MSDEAYCCVSATLAPTVLNFCDVCRIKEAYEIALLSVYFFPSGFMPFDLKSHPILIVPV
jgi:hypothetical protein